MQNRYSAPVKRTSTKGRVITAKVSDHAQPPAIGEVEVCSSVMTCSEVPDVHWDVLGALCAVVTGGCHDCSITMLESCLYEL